MKSKEFIPTQPKEANPNEKNNNLVLQGKKQRPLLDEQIKKKQQDAAMESSDEGTLTFYSGISKEAYLKYWKNPALGLKRGLTNATTNEDFAEGYSWDGTVIKISNVPPKAIVGVREDEYYDDSDWTDVTSYSDKQKEALMYSYSLFLLSLYKYKNTIQISLI